jgi:hypothetical protein
MSAWRNRQRCPNAPERSRPRRARVDDTEELLRLTRRQPSAGPVFRSIESLARVLPLPELPPPAPFQLYPNPRPRERGRLGVGARGRRLGLNSFVLVNGEYHCPDDSSHLGGDRVG